MSTDQTSTQDPDALPTMYRLSTARHESGDRLGTTPRRDLAVGAQVAIRRRRSELFLGVGTVTHADEARRGVYAYQLVKGTTGAGKVISIMRNIPARMLKVEATVAALDAATIAEKVRQAVGMPTRLEIVHSDAPKHVRNVGTQHQLFKPLLTYCQARLRNAYLHAATKWEGGQRLNIWIAGPAGSGKSEAARAVARALKFTVKAMRNETDEHKAARERDELPFFLTGAVFDKAELEGFIDAHGVVHCTGLLWAWEFGGVFCWDDVDRSDAQAFAAFNALLAGTIAAFPGGRMVQRHPDFICIATANTWGTGPTSQYVGACKLDAATLNRFVKVFWGYDEQFETALSGNAAWAARVQMIRSRIASAGIKVLCTPRQTFAGVALLDIGVPQHEVEELVLREGMAINDWKAVSA